MTRMTVDRPRSGPSPAAASALPERERHERTRFVARAVEHCRGPLMLHLSARADDRLELHRGRVLVHGHLAPRRPLGAVARPALLVLLLGAILLVLHVAGPWRAPAVGVAGWALLGAAPLALVVAAVSWWRTRARVSVLVDARRRRMKVDVLRSCWEQAKAAEPPPAELWVLARGGFEHAALQAAAALPVRCFVPTLKSFVEVHASAR